MAETSHPVWDEGVKALRGLHNLTQEQLAERAGTTQSRISEIENGRRSISDSLRIRIARALEVDPHDLFPYRENDGDSNGNGNAA